MKTPSQLVPLVILLVTWSVASTIQAAAPGSVVAWGGNSLGQTTVPVAAQSGVTAIACGWTHTLALKNDGAVVAWGNNVNGQTTVPVAAQSGVMAIAAGTGHSVALKTNGEVLVWGKSAYGLTTVPVTAQSGVTAIAAGANRIAALKDDGSVVVWGSSPPGHPPVPISAQSGVMAIAVGGDHIVALKIDGSVVAWGVNSGETTVPAAAQSGVTVIAAGGRHTVALKTDGSVVAWGNNFFGQTTVPLAAQTGVIAIAAGRNHTVALKNDGSVVAWGYNDYGQTTVPAGLSGVTAVSAGSFYTVALFIPAPPCPVDVEVSNNPGQCYASNVVFTVPDAGGALVTCQLNNTVITSPWSFNVGTNLITCTVSNFAGVGVCTFNVIVRDTEAPAFSGCPANQMLVVSPLSNSATAIFSPVAQDNCGTDGLVITCVPPSGSAFSLGTNNVTCTATDAAGNQAECSFQVVVIGARGVKQAVLAELIALRAGVTDKQDGKRLDQAIEHLTMSLAPDLWLDETHLESKYGERAFHEEKQTVKHLLDALKRESTTLSAVVIQDLIERIVSADRLLAAVAIAEAGGASDNAQREFVRAEVEAANGNPDKAIEHYAHAWRHTTHLRITQIVRAPDGRTQLQFLGEPLQKYAVQCSTDLKTWTTLDIRTTDADGVIEYNDAGAGKLQARFYRITTTP